jgi:hypothetical protein
LNFRFGSAALAAVKLMFGANAPAAAALPTVRKSRRCMFKFPVRQMVMSSTDGFVTTDYMDNTDVKNIRVHPCYPWSTYELKNEYDIV